MSQSNRVIIILLAALVAILLMLIVGSGACSGSGGGGGGGAQNAISSMENQVSSMATSENGPAGNATAGATETSGASAMKGYEDMTTDELREMLEKDTAPIGSNARSAGTSSNVLPASETSKTLVERGFGNLAIQADFDIDGNYIGMQSIESSSVEKYPSYMALYTSDKGIVWIIYVNDGNYCAAALGSESVTLPRRVILSESDLITQYDGDRNEYSEFSLSDLTEGSGVKVSRIDKGTLDSYSIEDLEKV